jgi:hypothetical protein
MNNKRCYCAGKQRKKERKKNQLAAWIGWEANAREGGHVEIILDDCAQRYSDRTRRSVNAYGFPERERPGRIVHLRAGLHHRCQFPVRGRQARRRARSRLFTVPCRRTLRWLFDNSVEGHLDRAAMLGGHSSVLSYRHIRQRLRLHETAPRRGERDLQGSDGVHGLSSGRSILSSATSR